VIKEITNEHFAIVRSYLKAVRQRHGLILNFAKRNSSAPRFELSRGTHPWPLPRGEYKKSPLGRGVGELLPFYAKPILEIKRVIFTG